MTNAPLYGKAFDRQSQYRDRLAQSLLAQGADASPVQHWTQGAARLAQALAGGLIGMKQDQRYAEREKQSAEAMANLFAPSQQFVPSAAGAGPRPGAQMQTVQPTLSELAQRAASNPATAHLAPQFQMQDIQNQQAIAQRGTWKPAEQNGLKGQVNSVTGEFKPDPMPRNPAQRYMNVPNVGLVDTSGDAPKIVIKQPQDGGGGPFAGTGMEAQAYNVLIDPKSDPASPIYAAAYSHLTQPKLQMVPGPDGQPVMSLVTPKMPPNIRQPIYAQQGAQPAPNAQTVTPDSGIGPGGSAMPQVGNPQQAPAQPAAPPATDVGGVTVQPIAPPKAPQLTEGQANAALYADRIREALPIIEKFGSEGTSIRNRAASSIPGAGNYLVSDGYQQLDQAQRNFINATLRRESGAVISPQEFENAAKQYFPQPGDRPEVLAQKKANRESAMAGISRAAGPAYKPQPVAAPSAGSGGIKFLGFEGAP